MNTSPPDSFNLMFGIPGTMLLSALCGAMIIEGRLMSRSPDL